jgi:hypothetical protein
MRKLIIAVLLAAVPLSSAAKKPVTTQMVTVAQLEQALTAAQGMPDGKLAKQIVDMKLTERLSDATFERLQTSVPSPKARLALLAIADESAFLDLPAAEIPSIPAPDHATQVTLIGQAMDYVQKAIPKLPDFFATRTTTRYLGTPLVVSDSLHSGLFPELPENQRLTYVATTSVAVRYCQGLEVFVDPEKAEITECSPSIETRGNTGEFGEILQRVENVATHAEITWSHWEHQSGRLLAVFHYKARFLYEFRGRVCPDEIELPPVMVDFHGEIGVDPDDGSILRLTEIEHFLAQLFDWLPAPTEVDSMVEYGPVEIGGKIYICPLRSVARALHSRFGGTRADLDRINSNLGVAENPDFEGLNDKTFAQYHIFRAKARIITGDAPE